MNYSIYIESTPNPKVMKFVSNRMLADKSLEFLKENDAKKIPMIYKIFSLPFVKSVFLSTNFISITKVDTIEWEEITLELRNFITRILNEDEIKNYSKNIQLVERKNLESPITEKEVNKELTDIENNIIGLLDEYIKPAVEGDGGAIEFDSYDNGIVKVILKGACSGCPSSTATLKQGIESLLIQKLGNEIKEVLAING
ncbi:MAG: NifU family protein [Flavobacteriales bacterium]|jgi:NFU1 iron-sulfur cluster scaffold homolog, mitochondrial|nr:NifU family protein [Flavobacteriales bacterium]